MKIYRKAFAVYEIECKTPNHRYVGCAGELLYRMNKHRNGNGAMFTQRHGVKSWRILCWAQTATEAKRIGGRWFSTLNKRGHILGGFTSMDLRNVRPDAIAPTR